MVPRFGFIEAKKGVWEVVKISTGPWMQYTDHEQALAEKDREISQLTQSIEMLRYALQGSQDQYQQLMEKAARFAKAYRNEHLSNWIELVSEEMAEKMAAKDPVYVEAKAFLKERA